MSCKRGRISLLTSFLALILVGTTFAQEDGKKPLAREEIDKRVYDTLRTIINQGADLYNNGDTQGCYRLYAGALLTTRSVLDHRPELQKAIDDGLEAAKAEPQLFQRAFVLRDVLDKIRKDVKGDDTVPPPVEVASVAGKVTLEGKPLAGAEVTFMDEKKKATTTKTEANGTYKADKLALGKYTVAVKAAGIDPKYADAAKSGFSLDAKKGDNVLDLSVTKPTPPPPTKGTVKGVVTLDGKPLAKGDVTFTDSKNTVTKAAIGAGGTYEVKDLAPGKYGVAVVADGVDAKAKDPKTSGLSFDIKAGENTNNISLKKPTPPPPSKGNVKGKVTLDGKPLAKGDVTFTDSKNAVTKAAIGAGGTYEVKDLAPGKYGVAVVADGVDDKAKDPKTSGISLDVKAGENTFDIQLKTSTPPPPPPAAKTGSVKGKVSVAGKAATGGNIYFEDATGSLTKGQIGKDGAFSVAGLKPGPYKVAVETPGAAFTAGDPKKSGFSTEVKEGDNTFDVNAPAAEKPKVGN